MKCPESLEYWTGDECAECLSISKDLSGILWGFVADAENPTPLGGDGSNGTVETPCGRLSKSNDDKVPHFWSKLSEAHQKELAEAADKHFAPLKDLKVDQSDAHRYLW